MTDYPLYISPVSSAKLITVPDIRNMSNRYILNI